MPDVTPIYSFSYPCLDEPVNWTDFQTLGDQIDAKLLEVQADANFATGRYNIARSGGSQAGIAVNVETVLANANAQYVVPVSGVYLTTYDIAIPAVTSITASRTRVRLNGVAQYGQSANHETGLAYDYQVAPSMVVAAAGDTFSAAFLYQGTGTATVSCYISSRLVVRIA